MPKHCALCRYDGIRCETAKSISKYAKCHVILIIITSINCAPNIHASHWLIQPYRNRFLSWRILCHTLAQLFYESQSELYRSNSYNVTRSSDPLFFSSHLLWLPFSQFFLLFFSLFFPFMQCIQCELSLAILLRNSWFFNIRVIIIIIIIWFCCLCLCFCFFFLLLLSLFFLICWLLLRKYINIMLGWFRFSFRCFVRLSYAHKSRKQVEAWALSFLCSS